MLSTRDPNAPAPGDVVALYIYDGLGRLVRRESPVAGYTDPRAEIYLYEGVRRIQERVDSPDGNDSEREYVYGRDYVDEVLFQFDEAGDAFYVLQDANYNVVALLKGGSGVPPEDLVVEQYTYSPYGEILAADILDPDKWRMNGDRHGVSGAAPLHVKVNRSKSPAASPAECRSDRR